MRVELHGAADAACGVCADVARRCLRVELHGAADAACGVCADVARRCLRVDLHGAADAACGVCADVGIAALVRRAGSLRSRQLAIHTALLPRRAEWYHRPMNKAAVFAFACAIWCQRLGICRGRPSRSWLLGLSLLLAPCALAQQPPVAQPALPQQNTQWQSRSPEAPPRAEPAGPEPAAAALPASMQPSLQSPASAPTPPAPGSTSDSGDAAATVRRDIGQQIFFDGRTTSANARLNQEIFEGDVVAIGAGTLIGADKITLDRARNVLDAVGSVVILSRNQLFIGDSVHYNLQTTDFAITQAVMTSNDAKDIAAVQARIFGFSANELAFEDSRKAQLAAVQEQRTLLRREAIRRGAVDDELVSRYSLLLEKNQLIASQDSPSLARLPQERRDALQRRRAFWEQSKASALASAPSAPLLTAYIHLEGDELTRVNGNDYAARNALFTPCKCDKDEAPAWAFRADEVDAQIGGYADMTDAVLEIKGVPVLYLPHIKVPLKEKRQSGFLMPTAGYDLVSGNTYTQPIYFDLGPSSDMTATTDIYENRGTRLGLEYRVQQREFSGWDLHLEGIRDSLWMQQIGNRQVLGEMYRNGYVDSQAHKSPGPLSPDLTPQEYTRRAVAQPDFWTQGQNANKSLGTPEQQIDTYMAIPRNTWRGGYGWRGVTYLAPRLSLVSNGDVTSDHRYTEELYLPDNFNDAFYGGRVAKAFATSHLQLHLDGRDFYAGLSSRWGDNYLTNQRFEGQQLPAQLKIQSRLYELTPEHFLVPIYGEALVETVQISQATAGDTLAPPVQNLGGGSWKRAQFSTTAPLVTNGIVQVSQFTNFESRFINHTGLETKTSEMRSWVAGFEFRLPIDGRGDAPGWLRSTVCEDAERDQKPRPPECPLPGDDPGQQYVQHMMDWRLRLATRPVVVKRGPYTEDRGFNLAYFATDKKAPLGGLADNDRDVTDEERFGQYQRITLQTDQAWSVTGRSWQRLEGALPDVPASLTETTRERARRELAYSLDQSVSGAAGMYNEATQRWLVDRFQLKDQSYYTPLTLHADIAYDFLDAKERKRTIAENALVPADKPQALLPEPWKPLNVTLGGTYRNFNLHLGASYNIYRHAATSESISLTFPQYLKTNVTVGYDVSKTFQSNSSDFQKTTVSSLSLDTTLITPVSSFIRLSRQVIQGQPTDYTRAFKTAYGLKYVSSSDCWGLQFAREKDYAVPEANASYVMRLSMVFMGQERPLPDMSGGIVHEANNERRF